MSTTSLTTSVSQSKIFQRTYSTLQDFVQSKHSYSERIEHNFGEFICRRDRKKEEYDHRVPETTVTPPWQLLKTAQTAPCFLP